MEEICKATKNFSRSFKIGHGGFGTVYEGQLKDGTLVAVKRANKNDRSKHLVTEFQSEIQTLALVEHLNIVKFYGYLERKDEMVVVVEHVPNGNLREHLDCVNGNVLDFAARLDIAIDVAHAVTYLHMYPADSGLGDTPVSTEVKGTAGYLDPEYPNTYQLTKKSDAYSFITGGTSHRQACNRVKTGTEGAHFARWVIKEFSKGDAILTLDPRLERSSANIFGYVYSLYLILWRWMEKIWRERRRLYRKIWCHSTEPKNWEELKMLGYCKDVKIIFGLCILRS